MQASEGSLPSVATGVTGAVTTTRGDAVAGDTSHLLRPGEQLDHFVLIRSLGEGGFGHVWLARDVRLGREVAIKLPHRRLRPGTVEARRFQREAEIAAKLTHPNLVPILEAVLDDERAYIVAEYCPGPTLSRWLRERSSPVPAGLAVSIVTQLADGLRIVHDRGLIHRDIKPSNIILTGAETESPTPRLTDFGLARTSSDASDTHVGALIGSGPYMSPEQASGNTIDHGPHSDVHALGVLLYELLTGESPFACVSELDTIRRIVSQDPQSVRQLRPSLSRDVSAVCQRCLEKQPARRYRNAGELFEDLRRILAGHPPIARPVGRIGRTWRWATRNRAFASMAATAVVGLVIGVIGLTAFAIESQRSAAHSEAQSLALSRALKVAENERMRAVEHSANADTLRARAVNQQRLAQQTREQSRRDSYTSDLSLAFQRHHQGHFGEARKLLDRQIPQSAEADLRSLEWKLLDSEVSSRYRIWGQHAGRGTELAVLPRRDDTSRPATVVSAASDGKLFFWDIASGQQTHQLSGLDGRVDAIAALPSGDLAISGPDWLWLGPSVVMIDPESGKTSDVLHGHVTTIESIRVSADANIIASGSRYENIRCWSNAQRRSFSIANGTRNVAFGLSKDGTRLLTSSRDPDALQVWDPHTGALMDQWETPSPGPVAMAHNHPYAAYFIKHKPGIGLVMTGDLNQRHWVETASSPHEIEFSPDDRFLAVADERAGVELFERFAENRSGAPPSNRPPEYRSVASFAGLGGRIEDVKFIGPSQFVTVSIDGTVEYFAPLRPSHDVRTIHAPEFHTMFAIAQPAGILGLNETGGLVHVPMGEGTTVPANAPLTQVEWTVDAPLTLLAVSQDHEQIAAIDSVGGVHLLRQWRNPSGAWQTPAVRTIDMPRSTKIEKTGFASFSGSSRYLAVMSDRYELLVYDLASDADKPMIRRGYPNAQNCVVFAPDETSLFICGYAGIDMVDLSTGESQFRLPAMDQVSTACFSPRGDRLIVGSQDGSIACLDPETGLSHFTLHSIDTTGAHSTRLESLRFFDDSKLMAIGPTGSVHFWNVDQRVQLGSFDIVATTKCETRCFDISRRGDALMVALDRGESTEVHRWAWPADEPLASEDAKSSGGASDYEFSAIGRHRSPGR